MSLKRSYGDAFKRQPLHHVQEDGFYVEHTVYKVIGPCEGNNSGYFKIKTSQNSNFEYGESVIKETATSATQYSSVKKVTKTLLIELFSDISINDVWFATFFTQDKNEKWQDELVTKIQSMEKDAAVKYVKIDFATLGKSIRELAGRKIAMKSDNNYYLVCDLNICFEELKTNDPETAAKNSTRKLDVNTLQSLIFNNVKYVLKQ